MDTHFNDQSSQIKALANMEKLMNFADKLTSVTGYNQKAMGQISLFDEDDVCAQDYQNIIDCTVGNNTFEYCFLDISTLII